MMTPPVYLNFLFTAFDDPRSVTCSYALAEEVEDEGNDGIILLEEGCLSDI